MNIKSISPSRINLKNLIVITQVSWNAMNIHNSKDCLLTLYFLFSYFGNNRTAFMDIKRASAPHNHQHGCSAVLRLGKKATVIILLELSSHGITHHHPIFWISQENLTGITLCKSACHFSKLN